ncbi:MAG: hypothetical protein AUG51_13160 [Acidobacteria bacterium 13_1_20CM_3_53_8]|nr:MAG: hypothetical protein AUG51_13160 [Acidobacteria bacterium 13_1_20CM_3_53_8]
MVSAFLLPFYFYLLPFNNALSKMRKLARHYEQREDQKDEREQQYKSRYDRKDFVSHNSRLN